MLDCWLTAVQFWSTKAGIGQKRADLELGPMSSDEVEAT
jgi:hypothetical protein